MESKYVVYLPSSLHTEHDHLNLLNTMSYTINLIYLMDICTFKDMIIQGRVIIFPKDTQSGAHLNYHESTIHTNYAGFPLLSLKSNVLETGCLLTGKEDVPEETCTHLAV